VTTKPISITAAISGRQLFRWGETNFRTRCRPDKNHFRFRSVSVQCLHPRACHVTTLAPYRMTGVSISSDEFTRNPCLFAELPPPPPGGRGRGDAQWREKSVCCAVPGHGRPIHLSTNEGIIARSGVSRRDCKCDLLDIIGLRYFRYVIRHNRHDSVIFFSRLRVLVITRRKSLN